MTAQLRRPVMPRRPMSAEAAESAGWLTGRSLAQRSKGIWPGQIEAVTVTTTVVKLDIQQTIVLSLQFSIPNSQYQYEDPKPLGRGHNQQIWWKLLSPNIA